MKEEMGDEVRKQLFRELVKERIEFLRKENGETYYTLSYKISIGFFVNNSRIFVLFSLWLLFSSDNVFTWLVKEVFLIFKFSISSLALINSALAISKAFFVWVNVSLVSIFSVCWFWHKKSLMLSAILTKLELLNKLVSINLLLLIELTITSIKSLSS